MLGGGGYLVQDGYQLRALANAADFAGSIRRNVRNHPRVVDIW
jgi:hypothetical protein